MTQQTPCKQHPLHAGFGKACVTPPLGVPMEGLGQQGGVQTIHDDLFVRALFLAQGETELLIVGFDLLFFERAVIDRLRGALGRVLEMKPSQILLNHSHTHAGPRVSRWAYSDGIDPEYLDTIETAVLDAATQAKAARTEVTVQAGTARTTMPVSRRKPDEHGQAQWAPYRNGIISDVLPFCLFTDAGGQVVSLLFSVSCHPSMIYSLDISAEYPGAAMRHLNAAFATEGSLFLQGAGGDTKPAPIAVNEDYWRQGTFDEMEAVGTEIAGLISAAATDACPVTPALASFQTDMYWPLQPAPARAEFEALLANTETSASRRRWAEDMLRRYDRAGRLPDHVAVGFHALQIGHSLRLVGLEGELVGVLGRQIIDRYRHGVTFPLGYTDGAAIYLPSTPMLAEHGYEVDSYWEYHHPAPLAPGMEAIIDRAIADAQAAGIADEVCTTAAGV